MNGLERNAIAALRERTTPISIDAAIDKTRRTIQDIVQGGSFPSQYLAKLVEIYEALTPTNALASQAELQNIMSMHREDARATDAYNFAVLGLYGTGVGGAVFLLGWSLHSRPTMIFGAVITGFCAFMALLGQGEY